MMSVNDIIYVCVGITELSICVPLPVGRILCSEVCGLSMGKGKSGAHVMEICWMLMEGPTQVCFFPRPRDTSFPVYCAWRQPLGPL